MIGGERVILSCRGGRVEAACIRVWRRDEGQRMIMSLSAGPKEMLHNDGLSLLDKFPAASAAAMLLLPGKEKEGSAFTREPVIGFLVLLGDNWTDHVTGETVDVQPVPVP